MDKDIHDYDTWFDTVVGHPELNEEAKRMADTHTPQMLAKLLLIEQRGRIELSKTVVKLNVDIQEMVAKAVDRYGELLGRTWKVEHERDELAAHVERLRYECSEAAIVLSECSNLHTLADCLISAANKTPTSPAAT